jgi:hypothetical protein
VANIRISTNPSLHASDIIQDVTDTRPFVLVPHASTVSCPVSFHVLLAARSRSCQDDAGKNFAQAGHDLAGRLELTFPSRAAEIVWP